MVANKSYTEPVMFTRPSHQPCDLCGAPVPQPKGRGRPRLYHPECGLAARAFRRLEKALAVVNATRKPGDSLAVEDMRSSLFDMANSLPRWRDASGRYRSGRGGR